MVGMELLPQLPLGLTALSASNMPDLVALPLLPGELTVLWLENVPNITALPVLPADLIELYMVDCDGVSCLPALPSGLALLTIYSATIDCLPAPLGPFVFPDLSFDPSTICTDPCITTTPLLGGRVFHDQNSNGLWDTGESPLQGAVITVLPGSLLASTNSSGQYLMAVPVGNYELSAASQTPYPQSVLPVVQSSLLLLTTDVDTTENFGIALEAGHHDLRAQIAATPSRPGFQNTVWASVTNHGTEPTGGDVTLGLDADQDWGYSSITPTSIAGNQVHWTMPPIAIGATWTVEVVLSTPIGTSIGTEIVHVLVVAADAVDEAPADDQALLTDVVVGSFDPNDKQVFPDEIELADLLVGQRVEYTIRFQNTGTAAASFVVVVDSLSSDLQWGTMRFESSSHPCSWEMRSGILRFRFDPIILPDSISDEPGSHGFVRFSMLPQPTLLPGYQVSNRADIYFDFNPPVATEPAIFNIIINTATSDVHQGAIMLHPIPAEDVLWVEVPMSDAMNWTMRILDMDGRVISTSEVTSGAKAVDVQDLRPGAYVLELSSSLQLLRTRFIKG